MIILALGRWLSCSEIGFVLDGNWFGYVGDEAERLQLLKLLVNGYTSNMAATGKLLTPWRHDSAVSQHPCLGGGGGSGLVQYRILVIIVGEIPQPRYSYRPWPGTICDNEQKTAVPISTGFVFPRQWCKNVHVFFLWRHKWLLSKTLSE